MSTELIEFLAEEYPDPSAARGLWKRAGGRNRDVPNIPHDIRALFIRYPNQKTHITDFTRHCARHCARHDTIHIHNRHTIKDKLYGIIA